MGNGGLPSDMFRGLSMSGKRRSTSGFGRGKSDDLSLTGDRGLSGQRRKRVSMIRKAKSVFKGVK